MAALLVDTGVSAGGGTTDVAAAEPETGAATAAGVAGVAGTFVIALFFGLLVLVLLLVTGFGPTFIGAMTCGFLIDSGTRLVRFFLF